MMNAILQAFDVENIKLIPIDVGMFYVTNIALRGIAITIVLWFLSLSLFML
jgi:hypothetical protein